MRCYGDREIRATGTFKGRKLLLAASTLVLAAAMPQIAQAQALPPECVIHTC